MSKNKTILKKRYIVLIAFIILVIIQSMPQIVHKNKGQSQSIGTSGKGELINGYKIPYKGKNYSYFSLTSYYLLGTCYVNDKLYSTLIDTYKNAENEIPGIHFRIMECSKRKGGKMLIHRTHQNGLSVDFMTPLKKNDKTYRLYDRIGLSHYLMNSDEEGIINKNVSIDFETIAKHILIVNEASKKNNLHIKKIIFNTDLKDELFSTPSGKILKTKNIYFAKYLKETLNKFHDDHYHIDFEEAHQ